MSDVYVYLVTHDRLSEILSFSFVSEMQRPVRKCKSRPWTCNRFKRITLAARKRTYTPPIYFNYFNYQTDETPTTNRYETEKFYSKIILNLILFKFALFK